jgi:hypothetical protein
VETRGIAVRTTYDPVGEFVTENFAQSLVRSCGDIGSKLDGACREDAPAQRAMQPGIDGHLWQRKVRWQTEGGDPFLQRAPHQSTSPIRGLISRRFFEQRRHTDS